MGFKQELNYIIYKIFIALIELFIYVNDSMKMSR